MADVLNVSAFGGGVVLEGSSDAQRTDELRACDGYDIGARGQLVASSDVSAYDDAEDGAFNALDLVYSMWALSASAHPGIVYVGDRGANTYIGFMPLSGIGPNGSSPGVSTAAKYRISFVSFPYVIGGTQNRILLVAIAARANAYPKTGLGLFAATLGDTGVFTFVGINHYDALGTGDSGEFPTGTKGKMLFPRFIFAYNNFAIAVGYDSADSTNGDGPNRVMLSNIGNPLKWGFDAKADAIAAGTASETDRDFVDSDAVTIGGAGTQLRAGLTWAGRAWLGANNGLHYLEGNSRESIKTNGIVSVRGSKNVVGPGTLIEGPDNLMHGVGDEGHWIFNGGEALPVGDKLRDLDGKSPGFWDCIWTDASRSAAAFPGQTNQDLVWMLADSLTKQVVIGIPYCSASAGFGYGTDTIVIKYHVNTGGYTRQVFSNKIILTAIDFKREQTAERAQYWGGSSLATNITRYRYSSALNVSPALPASLDVTFGEYAPFGPTGVGVFSKRYLTLSWVAAVSTLGLVFSLTATSDGESGASVTLSIQPTAPVAPADGDYWLDTSGMDTNLGNATAGDLIPAHVGDYIFRTYKASWAKWVQVPGSGQQGRRVTLPIRFIGARGTRFTVRCLSVAADRRFQIEGLSEQPGFIRAGT